MGNNNTRVIPVLLFVPDHIHYLIMPYSCYLNLKCFNTKPKCNVLLLGVFTLIISVIILIICTRNYVEKPGKESLLLCSGNLLDKRGYHYAKEAGGSYDNSRMISSIGLCHLLDYSFERAVGCIDALYVRYNSTWNSPHILNHVNGPDRKLHFAFIGDSRIRQQFFNFLKVYICSRRTISCAIFRLQ